MKVLLVDHQIMFREGLASLFAAQPDIEVIGVAGSIKEAISLAHILRPDLVLMEANLPDGEGPAVTQVFLATNPDTKVVFLTEKDEDHCLFEAIRSGAKGYLLKNLPVAKLLEYLRGLDRHEAALSGEMTARVLEEFSRLSPSHEPDRRKLTGLTTRELEILRELTVGASNEVIAGNYGLSVNTVKSHIHNILRKLELRNRREAARYLSHEASPI